MATRDDRLPALRRLSTDPGATPAERALAGRLAAELSSGRGKARETSRAPQLGKGVVLDCSGAIPWLRWRCPACGESLAHPGDRLSGAPLFALVASLSANEDARCCWFCSSAPSALEIDGNAIPGAVPAALWDAANPGAPDAGDLLLVLESVGVARIEGGSRSGARRRIAAALLDRPGAFRQQPQFILRGSPDGFRIRWRTPGKAAS